MKAIKLSFLLLILPILCFGSDGKPAAVLDMSPVLLTEANAVIRLDERHFELSGQGRGRLEVKKEITILNEDGLDHSKIRLHYNSFSEINRVRIELLDAAGDRIRKMRTRNMEDESVISGYSVFEDSRVKKADLRHDRYPYTIRIEYRKDFSGFIQLPTWTPLSKENTSLFEAVYTVELPAYQPLDYRAYSMTEPEPEVRQSGEIKTYSWRIDQMPVIEREYMGPPWFELFPALVLKTGQFHMEGNTGSMHTWENFGSWFGQLWDGRDELPESIKQ